jgi:hypothetical protein
MERQCDVCQTTYTAKRITSRYCSTRCRTRACRKGASNSRATVTPLPTRAAPAGEHGPIEAATLAELEAVDRVGVSAGQRALMLARLLDDPSPLALSSVAGWSREHGAAMDAAMVGVEKPREKSALDRAREKRDAKRHA